MKLLHIDSSILGGNSASRQLSREVVARWQARVPGLRVIYRDLAAEPLAHLSGASLAQTDPEETQRNAQTLEQFLAANVIVIGAPMYNFAIPSQLKAWIDRILVAGKTFRYTPSGAEGLAGGKRVIIAVARGGVYAADSPLEFAESYLRQVFAFVGVPDVTVVRAEGLALSPQQRNEALRQALESIAPPLEIAA